jgi:hypothetical protein
VPRHKKAAERFDVNGLDFLAKPRQRSPPQGAQHVGVDPLAFGAARPELAFDDLARCRELQEQCGCDADAEPIARGELACGEGPVGSRITEREVSGGVSNGSSSDSGSPTGNGTPRASRYRATSSTAT